MGRWNLLFVLMMLFATAGCGRSLELATQSYDRSVSANEQVRHAMFIKAWGINRALITEARIKWMNEAIIHVLKAQGNGVISAEAAEEAIRTFENELGKDEAVASENFAYLSFLLLAGERADQLSGNVETYLASQTPIWKSGSKELQDGVRHLTSEIEIWKPILGDLKKALPASLIQNLTEIFPIPSG